MAEIDQVDLQGARARLSVVLFQEEPMTTKLQAAIARVLAAHGETFRRLAQ